MRSARAAVRAGAAVVMLTLAASAARGQDTPPILLEITTPSAGAVINPGQTIVITVAAIGNAPIARIAAIGGAPFGPSTTSSTVPAQFTFVVPPDITPRRYSFSGTGSTAAGVLVRSRPIDIDVERPDLPRSLSTLIPSLTLGVTGERLPVVVLGTFADDSVLDVTRSSRLTYRSADPNIATVDAEGVVTAVRPGRTSVTATYTLDAQTVAAALPVTVRSQALSPSAVGMAFGEQAVGTGSAPQSLTITNTAAAPVRIVGISVSDEFTQTNDCPVETRLAPGASCVVSIVFTPTGGGARTGALEIAGSTHVVPAVIALTGTATALDTVAPVTGITLLPAPAASGWNNADVTLTLTTADEGVAASGVDDVTFSASGAQPIASTRVPGATASAAITTEGATTVSYFATDRAGNAESPKSVVVKLDKSAPALTCAVPDALWHATDVAVACTARDDVSGLLNANDATVEISTAVPSGTETATAETGSYRVCDVAGSCALAGPLSNIKIDKRPPVIVISAPAVDAAYVLHQSAAAAFACVDEGSGTASCAGPVPAGGPIDTASVGAKTFSVTATDDAGNAGAGSNRYSVQYGSGPCLGNPGRQVLAPLRADATSIVKQGSTVPVKFRVCDANGVSIGTAGLVSSFVLVTAQTGNVNDEVNVTPTSTTPDATFRWDAAGRQWIFNLNTNTLAANTTYVYRIALNDGTAIGFSFKVK